MSTEAQIAANQANAQRSTGPVTETGKAVSCLNNLKYGLTGGSFSVLPWEDEEDYRTLYAALRASLDPRNPFERLLVEKMAQHQWLSQRALVLQDMCLPRNAPDCEYEPAPLSAAKVQDDEPASLSVAKVQDDEPASLSVAKIQDDEPASLSVAKIQERKLALYLRYQTTHERAYSKYFDQLLKLRAEARKARLDEAALQRAEDARKIGFESQKQIEAEAARKQEAHEARVRLANAKAADLELETDIRSTIEARLPGHVEIPFDRLKSVLKLAIEDVARHMATEKADA